MMSAVVPNQNRDRPVRTRPLSGIGVGRTTSKALNPIRGDEEEAILADPIQVADLPGAQKVRVSRQHSRPPLSQNPRAGRWRRPRPQPGIESVEAGDDHRHVAQEAGVVEAGIEARERQAPGDRRVRRQDRVQLETIVRRPQGVALDDRVSLLAREAAVLDQGDQHPAAGVEAEATLDVLAHPVGADDEAVHEDGHPGEHVVQQDRRVGENDALRRRVADVALVPERLVLERRAGVAAEQAGQPRDSLGDDRVPLVRHRGASLLPAAERLHELADLGVLKVADLGGEPLERAAGDRDRRDQRRVPIALDDLGAHRVDRQPEARRGPPPRGRAPGGCRCRPAPRSCRSRRPRWRMSAGAGRARARRPSRQACGRGWSARHARSESVPSSPCRPRRGPGRRPPRGVRPRPRGSGHRRRAAGGRGRCRPRRCW